MTIICQFSLGRQVYLIGDTLISSPVSQIIKPIKLPIKIHKNNLVADIDHMPTTLIQKLHIIEDDLAFAWSGSLIHAKHLLKRIIEDNISKDEISNFIDHFYKEEKNLNLSVFILRIYGEQIQLSTTDAEYMEIYPFGEVSYAGSGKGDVLGFMAGFGSSLDSQTIPKNISLDMIPRGNVFSMFSAMYCTHFLTGLGITNFWGGVLELISTNSGRFEKFDDYMFVFWDIFYESEKSVRFSFGGYLIKIKYICDFLIVKIVDFRGTKRPIRPEAYIIPPLVQISGRPDINVFYDIPWKSMEVIHFSRMFNHPGLGVLTLIDSWEEFSRFCEIEDSIYGFHFRHKAEMANRILNHMGFGHLNSYRQL